MQPLSRRFSTFSLIVVFLTILSACSDLSQPPPDTLAIDAQAVPTTVASGLNNPRGLSFTPNGALLVAEAGIGGDIDCFVGPEGDDVCLGLSGSVTKVWKGSQTRIITGLPSIAAPDGSGAIGPSDVSVHGNGNTFVTVGLGADPAVREEVGDAASLLGHLLRLKQQKGSYSIEADIAGFEASDNPDAGEEDSNPNSVVASGGVKVVADAGGNSLVKVAADGKISVIAVFPDTFVDAPPFLGLPPGAQIPMQAVPTSVVVGPDGAYYVGQLTGFPFPNGAAKVFRVVEGQAPEVYAEGFTNIIDLAFRGNTLYVLEIATNSLLSGDVTGALKQVEGDGSVTTLLTEPLVAPGGLAVGPDDAFYISNFSIFPGAGEVLRFTP